MPSHVELRRVATSDALTVAELSAQLGYPTPVADMLERIREFVTCEEQAAFVACVEGTVVGWIEVAIVRHLHSERHAVIGGLVVRETVRSRGIGKALCAEAERWAAAKGVSILRVRSNAKRADAHRFYLREGFTQTKTSAVFEKRLAKD